MITKRILETNYGDKIKIEDCKDCESQNDFSVVITKMRASYSINIANSELGASILSHIEKNGKLRSLKNEGDSIVILTRCVCFQVTDENGTRTECFLCQDPPDARCYGPFPYCPTTNHNFSFNDDSINYVRTGVVYVPNSVCATGRWVTMLNDHPNRYIRVFYDWVVNGVHRPMVCTTHPRSPLPDPNDYGTLLGCEGGDFRITSSVYI